MRPVGVAHTFFIIFLYMCIHIRCYESRGAIETAQRPEFKLRSSNPIRIVGEYPAAHGEASKQARRRGRQLHLEGFRVQPRFIKVWGFRGLGCAVQGLSTLRFRSQSCSFGRGLCELDSEDVPRLAATIGAVAVQTNSDHGKV